jgi:hypothetical protein
MMARASRLTACLAAAVAVACPVLALAADARAVPLWYIGETAGSAWLGAQQGLTEINLQGRFAGFEFELRPATMEQLRSAGAVEVVLAAVPAASLETLSEALPQVPIFNLAADDDTLRAACRPNLFSTLPSAGMKRDALGQWREANPQGEAEAVGWNHNFRRYSSRDLNRRFLDASGRPMDDIAWAGWAAVRIAGEAVMRTASTDPGTLRAFLREDLSFDGSKGFPLTFRETGQLRQPIWIVRDERVIAEAPIAGVADPDDLDTLGLAGCPPETNRKKEEPHR